MRGEHTGRQGKNVNEIMAQDMYVMQQEMVQKGSLGDKVGKNGWFWRKKAKNSATLCLTNSQLPGIIYKNHQGGALWKSGGKSLRGKGANL